MTTIYQNASVTSFSVEPVDVSAWPIKPGDRLFVSNGMIDVEGIAVWAIEHPFDEMLKIREDDGTELSVAGWLCDDIEINGEPYGN